MSIRLSKNFVLSEFTTSQTAARLGIDNTPDKRVFANLLQLAKGLEIVREDVLEGRAVIVSSGYRSLELNTNPAIGGSRTSDHVHGFAADIICPSFGSPKDVFDSIRHSAIIYDQLILEFGRWVHISFSPRLRQQSLIASLINKKAEYRFA